MSDKEQLSISEADKILGACCEIEETCAYLYRYFSRIYADNPKASELWEKTAKEEDNHAAQFHLACRIKYAGMTSLQTDLNTVNALLAKIQSVYDGVQKSIPTLKEAFRFAIALEQAMAAYHMHAVAKFEDKSLEKLFISMMKSDNEHIQMLEAAHKKL
jgi:rubrerythrin